MSTAARFVVHVYTRVGIAWSVQAQGYPSAEEARHGASWLATGADGTAAFEVFPAETRDGDDRFTLLAKFGAVPPDVDSHAD